LRRRGARRGANPAQAEPAQGNGGDSAALTIR
jgi:hypothetical protein